MAEIIKFNNGIEYVEIQNMDGKPLTVLVIDKTDKTIAGRFANMIKQLTGITEKAQVDEEQLNRKYAETSEDDVNLEKIIETSKIHIKYINDCIKEIDEVFGENTIKNVFAENYAVNEDFIPDEYALLEFVESVIPLMNRLFNERFETNKRKYNVGRKHNWTKEELIKQHMEKTHE